MAFSIEPRPAQPAKNIATAIAINVEFDCSMRVIRFVSRR
jgi:hypothetical protein